MTQDGLRIEAWSRQLIERLNAINVEKGPATEFTYMVDAGEWQDPFGGFPAENVARMRKIKTLYDPLGVFSTLNWGGLKLSV